MNITELKEKKEFIENIKLSRIYVQFQDLLKDLRKKELPQKIIELINQDIEDLNSTSFTGKELKKMLKQKQARILSLLEKELKIVPKDHYQNIYLTLGVAIGSGIGIAISESIFGNFSYFPIFTGIGLALGIVYGSSMDKKAFKDGRQIDVKIRY